MFDTIRQFNFPTTIRFGKGAVEELGHYLKSLESTRPLIVTDKSVATLPFFEQIVLNLRAQGHSVEIFTDIAKNPIKKNVHDGALFFHETGRDSVIGLGGGASMDVARAICLKVYHTHDLFYYEEGAAGEQEITGQVPLFITIPTTSGTGSEVGRSSIISDDLTHEKKIIFHPSLLAKIVFADPLLTMELPPFITAATGMDALTHNIEALVAKNYHPMCEGIALEGIKLIANSLQGATHKPTLENRAQMQLGSLMGAVAFQKGLGVVHSLAHPMSTLFDTHHGLANALNLPYGVRFNLTSAPDKFAAIAQIFKTQNLFETLLNLNKELGLPERLSEIGIKAQDIAALSDLAIKDFAHPNNPRVCLREDFVRLYQEAL